jgi:hypothetical protein
LQVEAATVRAHVTRMSEYGAGIVSPMALCSSRRRRGLLVAVAPWRKRFAFVAGNDGPASDSIVKQHAGHASAFSRRDASELCVDFRPREN